MIKKKPASAMRRKKKNESELEIVHEDRLPYYLRKDLKSGAMDFLEL